MTTELYIGIISGTSMDGADFALVGFDVGHAATGQLIATHYISYPDTLKESLLTISHDIPCAPSAIWEAQSQITDLYTRGVLELLKAEKLTADQVKAIGCHGQTLFHLPPSKHGRGFSIQVIDNCKLAVDTQIKIVSDLRNKDMAHGGQGAPLVPAIHKSLFQKEETHRFIVNIGGISNLSYLPAKPSEPVVGYDTGPGNSLSDFWILEHKGESYDRNGDWARSGTTDQPLLQAMMQDPYFQLPAPKSTGREYFNPNWLRKFSRIPAIPPEDTQATLIELTAQTIVQSCTKTIDSIGLEEPVEVYICGGGGHNHFLCQRIEQALQSSRPNAMVGLTDQLGLNIDWVEAYAFAWLAKQHCHNQRTALGHFTGSTQDTVAGTMTKPD